jgi:hypothetical protein
MRPRANVVTHPLPSAIGLNAREERKANLCPIVDALREFQRFVLCLVGGSMPSSTLLLPLTVKLEWISTMCRGKPERSEENKNCGSRRVAHLASRQRWLR